MGILDEAKSIAKLVQQIDNKDLYSKILDLQSHVVELYGENITLREKVAELIVAAKQREQMKFDGVVYWSGPGMKAPENGPYCPGCWGKDGKMLALRSTGVGHWYCMGCQQGISGPGADSGIQTARTERYDPLNDD